MRLISTKIHCIFDYAMSLLLLGSPLLFHYPVTGNAYAAGALAGSSLVLASLLTAFEFSPLKILSPRIHFWIDCIIGTALAISPWLLNYVNIIYKPQLVFGLSIVVVSLLTDRVPTFYVKSLLYKSQKQKTHKNIPDRSDDFDFVCASEEDLLLRLLRRARRFSHK